MAKHTPDILEDERKILTIFIDGEDALYYTTKPHGKGKAWGCDEIRAYPEPGMHCNLPWFAVIKGGEISHRIPAGMVVVEYQLEE